MPDLDTYIRRIDGALKRIASAPLFPRREVPLSPQGLPYAGFNRRMLASSIDAFIIMLLLMPFNDWFVTFAYHDMALDPAAVDAALAAAKTQAEADMALVRLQLDAGLARGFLRLMEIQYAALALYSLAFWHFYSSTPGKLLLGLRIVDAKSGERIGGWQGLIRVIGYALSSAALLLGFFAIAWNPRRQGWHDRLARTAVVGRAKLSPPAAHPSDCPAPEESE